jgi:formylglycine-generating enzyme required for sulfatase activity
MPMTKVTFLDCMRFANWLHHAQSDPSARGPAKSPADAARLTETGAYSIATGGGLAAREPNAQAWIPNEDEWYKAAYHHPRFSGGPPSHYWRYPTCSDIKPEIGKPGDTGPNRAIYMLHWEDPRGIPPVGSLPGSASHYGTLDQGSGVWEWVEATVFDAHRMLRGGSVLTTHEKMLKQARSNVSPSRRYPDVGFRVARAAPPPTISAPQAKPAPVAEPAPEAKP